MKNYLCIILVATIITTLHDSVKADQLPEEGDALGSLENIVNTDYDNTPAYSSKEVTEASVGTSDEITAEDVRKLLLHLELIKTSISKLDDRLGKLESEVKAVNPTVHQIVKKISQVSITQARATLYGGKNFTGTTEGYRQDRSTTFEGGCQDVSLKKVQSVDTYGTCVRLFWDTRCRSWSLALYPGSSTNPEDVLSSDLSQVKSIGPCTSNEFLHGNDFTFSVQKNSSDSKHTVPDLVEFYGYVKWYKGNPIPGGDQNDRTLLGPSNRPEFVRMLIASANHGRHYRSPSFLIDESDWWEKVDKHLNDTTGYAVPIAYGGPPDKRFNTFPQSPSAKLAWDKVTSEASSVAIQYNRFINMAISFQYEDNITTRPHSFDYWVYIDQKRIFYGRIYN